MASRKIAVAAGVMAAVTVGALAMAPGPFGFDFQLRSGPLDIYSSATPAPLLRCVPEFAIGLLTFRTAQYWARAGFRGAGIASAAAFAALAGCLARPGYDLAAVAVLPVLLAALAAQRGIVPRLLGLPGPYLLGELSYSIYVIHDKFTHLETGFSDALAGYTAYASAVSEAVTAAAVVACAWVT